MLNKRSFMLMVLVCSSVSVSSAWATKKRINLADFGKVVHFPDPAALATTSPESLYRGTDGWVAIRDEEGQYTIGIEWDEPRDISEVNIEFRHAIADRKVIKAQYWKEADEPATRPVTNESGTDKPVAGQWLTPEVDWWAGDRDVSFAFEAEDRETAGKKQPGTTFRRTRRLRFLCGKSDQPPVRFLRVYGPGVVTEDTFDIRFDSGSALTLPVNADLTNGFVLTFDGSTMLASTVLRKAQAFMEIRYFRDDAASPNRTEVWLSPVDKPQQAYRFLPAEVAQRGRLSLPEAGIVIERRGGKPLAKAVSQPATSTRAE